MAEQDQDKTEDATSYRLEEARRKGEVSKSADLTGSAVMIVFAAVFALTAGWVFASIAQATRATLLLPGSAPLFGAGLVTWMGKTWAPVWQALTPLALALIVVAVLANVLQTGPVFSAHPITPDFKRLNPMQVVKRLFSMRTIWELGKMLLKIGLLSAVAWMAWGAVNGLVAAVAAAPPQSIAMLAGRTFVRVSLYVLPILALLSLLDLLMVRREYSRKMRTSRRELRDEVKRRDGDPEVKSRQRQLIRDLLRKARSVPKAAEADIILTNPTHVAVALRYRPATMRAPIVLAKGAGFLGQRIRDIASRHNVPVMRSPELARALYRDCEIDGPVPEALYQQLAPVYRWLLGRNAAPAGHAAP